MNKFRERVLQEENVSDLGNIVKHSVRGVILILQDSDVSTELEEQVSERRTVSMHLDVYKDVSRQNFPPVKDS